MLQSISTERIYGSLIGLYPSPPADAIFLRIEDSPIHAQRPLIKSEMLRFKPVAMASIFRSATFRLPRSMPLM